MQIRFILHQAQIILKLVNMDISKVDNKLIVNNGVEIKEFIPTSVIGERAYHVFDNGNKKIEEECDLAEYELLRLKNATSPKKEGYTWCFSYKDWKYDTLSGKLEDGYYVEVDGNKFLIKQVDKPQEWIK